VKKAARFSNCFYTWGTRESGLSDAAKKVIARIDTPRKIKVFVSPTCPYCPQQAVNAVKAVIEKPELISLELVDIQCKPEIADQYSAHSVPQAFANDILIGLGAQSEEVFVSSLQKMEPQTVFIPDSDAEEVEDGSCCGGRRPGRSHRRHLRGEKWSQNRRR
jgi:thioredoxin reductase (NADPH)